MTDFYGYNENIINSINKKGYNVFWYKDKVELSYFERVISKIFKFYKKHKFNKYFKKSLRIMKNYEIDKILVIFGANFMNDYHILKLKEKFQGVKIIYYAWDSVSNFPNIEKLFSAADISYSFDPMDSKKYGVKFLPLFYTFDKNELDEKKYDVSSIMSVFTEKCLSLEHMLKLIPSGMNSFYFFKVRDYHYLSKIKNEFPTLYNKYCSAFKIDKMEYSDCLDVFAKSKVVIDIPLPNQIGLTMRTFEVLSTKTKLITTNKNIRNYDFYCEDNIFVIDEDVKIIPLYFFEKSFNEKFSLDKKYFIDNFVETLIGDGDYE